MRTLIELARPRTLPLAFAVICCGNALAYSQGCWRGSVFALSLLTALSLQILSNIANDYGDGVRGSDRYRAASAPRRLTASGAVSIRQMRALLAAGVLASLTFGIALLAVSSPGWHGLLLFLLLGALAILAAITYTVGRYAYGYYALGEASVFCFFGLLGVIGSYYLQSGSYRAAVLLPATGCGLLAAAVLHINNMRDIESDAAVGKYTIAGKLGFARSRPSTLPCSPAPHCATSPTQRLPPPVCSGYSPALPSPCTPSASGVPLTLWLSVASSKPLFSLPALSICCLALACTCRCEPCRILTTK